MATFVNMPSRDPAFDVICQSTHSIHQYSAKSSSLSSILQEELGQIQNSVEEWHNSDCLFQDLGNFISRTTLLLAQLASRVVENQHTKSYAEARIKEEFEATDGSDLDLLYSRANEHKVLRSLAQQLQETAHSLNDTWSKTSSPTSSVAETTSQTHYNRALPRVQRDNQNLVLPNPPASLIIEEKSFVYPAEMSSTDVKPPLPHVLPHISHTMSQSSVLPNDYMTQTAPVMQDTYVQPPQILPASLQPQLSQESAQSFTSKDHSLEGQVHDLLEKLTTRGTGQHRCPYQEQCNKGGCDAVTGEVIVFERNSAFRAHLQKHGKTYKCHKPGCTAKGGFARIDQLKRHQQSVPHQNDPPITS